LSPALGLPRWTVNAADRSGVEVTNHGALTLASLLGSHGAKAGHLRLDLHRATADGLLDPQRGLGRRLVAAQARHVLACLNLVIVVRHDRPT